MEKHDLSESPQDLSASRKILSDFGKQLVLKKKESSKKSPESGVEMNALRSMDFCPREEKNMSFDDKVLAWLDRIFIPTIVLVADATESSGYKCKKKYAYPVTSSVTMSVDSKCGEEQHAWREITRQVLSTYRNETERPFSVIQASRQVPSWQSNSSYTQGQIQCTTGSSFQAAIQHHAGFGGWNPSAFPHFYQHQESSQQAQSNSLALNNNHLPWRSSMYPTGTQLKTGGFYESTNGSFRQEKSQSPSFPNDSVSQQQVQLDPHSYRDLIDFQQREHERTKDGFIYQPNAAYKQRSGPIIDDVLRRPAPLDISSERILNDSALATQPMKYGYQNFERQSQKRPEHGKQGSPYLDRQPYFNNLPSQIGTTVIAPVGFYPEPLYPTFGEPNRNSTGQKDMMSPLTETSPGYKCDERSGFLVSTDHGVNEFQPLVPTTYHRMPPIKDNCPARNTGNAYNFRDELNRYDSRGEYYSTELNGPIRARRRDVYEHR